MALDCISLMENYHQWILFFHHMVDNHLCDKQGPFVTIHIPGLHWIKCFICNAISKWMHECLKLNHSIYHSSCYIHDISNNWISIYANIFHNFFFGMAVYANISVIYPLIQADPSRPTCILCVPTEWGILISRLNCLLWSQAHKYFKSLRPSDCMAAKFCSSLLQPMACPQYGAKWVPGPIVI